MSSEQHGRRAVKNSTVEELIRTAQYVRAYQNSTVEELMRKAQ